MVVYKQENWTHDADVVIVGFGYAGAVAAITAHDLGARVLLVEKNRHPGGLSAFAGGGFRFAEDPESAFKYLKRTCLSTTPDDVLRVMAQGMTEFLPYLKKLADEAGLEYSLRRNTGGTYDFEGSDTFGYFRMKQNRNFPRYDWLHTHGTGWIVFKLLEEEVKKREIQVLLSTRFREFITESSSGEILGCSTSRNSEELRIRSRRAVILTCGGFEVEEQMKLQFLQAQPVFAGCPSSNEGDGIKAAQKLGAQLWHMWHLHGSYAFVPPGSKIAHRVNVHGARKDLKHPPISWIVVDKFGRRYMNEYPQAIQDMPWRDMSVYDSEIQDFPRIPSHMILDDVGRKYGPLFATYYVDGEENFDDGDSRHEWSNDNSLEIKNGWISEAQSIEDLGRKIQIDPETLSKTINRWNEMCAAGRDQDFERPKESLAPIIEPPFFAVKLWPMVSNTQGGLAHDKDHRVLDSFGNPIERLYAAGEITSVFGHLYLQAGNAAECVVGGRISAQNAVREEPL